MQETFKQTLNQTGIMSDNQVVNDHDALGASGGLS